ncbi:MAG: hypothetical protein P4N59_33780 [Negativicutes bacterium]|nr:hypothetical protein [Negativicutes bacterium]
MKKFVRILVGIFSLAAVIGYVLLVVSVKDWRLPMSGTGDNAVNEPESASGKLFAGVVIGIILVLPVSPYLCMVAGAFNLIAGKLLRVAYVYSLVVLVLMTLILVALGTLQRKLELIALANIVLGTLWAYSGRPQTGMENRNE